MSVCFQGCPVVTVELAHVLEGKVSLGQWGREDPSLCVGYHSWCFSTLAGSYAPQTGFRSGSPYNVVTPLRGSVLLS